MPITSNFTEKYLDQDLWGGLMLTPQSAIERLIGLGIKRIADLLKKTESQVRDMLVLPDHDVNNPEDAKRVDRAVQALKSDLGSHDCNLA